MSVTLIEPLVASTSTRWVGVFDGRRDIAAAPRSMCHHQRRHFDTLYPVYTTKQSSSKHRAIRAHVVRVYFECICWMFARWLLDVCL